MTEDTPADLPWPIYVISLADAAERRRKVSRQLDSRGLEWRFVDGIDGRNGLPEAFQSAVDRPGTVRDFGREMSDGEYACALSHLSVYREIVARDLPGAIVLEDDAILSPGFDTFLAERAYLSAPLIQMDHQWARVPKFARSHRFSGFRVVPLYRNAWLSTCYSVSRTAAEYFVENAPPLRFPADWPCDVTRIGGSVTLPRIAGNSGSAGSYLEGGRVVMSARAAPAHPPRRFLSRAYWRKWWMKRMTWAVS